MGKYININGHLAETEKSGLSIHNRAFKYGDSVFETMRVINGRVLFLEDHFSRLNRAIAILKYEVPETWSISYCRREIEKLIQQNEIVKGGRVRLSLFRKAGGKYTPIANDMQFTIEAESGEENAFLLNEQGLQLGIYDEIRINPSILSPFKTNNCLPFILAGLYTKDSIFDDVLLLNLESNLVEAVSSNAFILLDGILYTPPIKDGCTAGVMRKKVIQISKKLNVPVIETSLNQEIIAKAEEVFLTNSISGLRWVKAFDKTRFFHKLSERIIGELNQIANR